MIETTAAAAGRPAQPYPGLRPFEAHEWSIFFGRERMIDEVIERLAAHRLVLIHGASGSGKSSLVRAGIMPKLARQHQRHGTPWLTCAMRPSGGPLWNLASEFARLEGRADDVERIGIIVGLFNRRGTTLASVAGAVEGIAGKSLCILVDQFEELFRFEKETSREEAELFVDLLARATETEDAVDLHVVVTMRSEFLGECARFDGLAEIINRTQYLVPRMDDEALMRAVRRPAQLFKGAVPEALADRLVAQVRGREDELPLLQHGLMLMWDEAARHPSPERRIVLDGAMVEQAGGLAELLSAHADRVMDSVAPDAARAKVVEALFRELTDVNAEGSAIRRPRSFANLAAVTGASAEDLHAILDAFRAPGASFLTPYAPAPITERSIIDVSHEALIRCWRRIASGEESWLRREFDDGLAWRSLLAEAEAFEKNRARVLSAAATEDRGSLFASRNEVWSHRYGGGWPRVGQLLEASRKAAVRSRRNARVTLTSLTVISISALALVFVTTMKSKQAEAQNIFGRKLLDQITQHNKSCPKGIIVPPELLNSANNAAEKGNSNAYFMLGLMYSCGYGTLKDYVQSYKWYEKAAMAGDTTAMLNIGRMYAAGHGVPYDEAKAREWWEKAASAGDETAMLFIGMLYDLGGWVPQDYAKAREWWEKAASAGSVAAMKDLAEMYDTGKGVQEDHAKAYEWYDKAAIAGEADAMFNVGVFYANGQGVPQDYAKAREWYEKAAAAGNANAMFNMGVFYANGQDVPQDYAKAREWYEKAADLGNVAAIRSIGVLFYDGDGVPQDFAKAKKLFEQAAAAGDTTASRGLGLIYELGSGVSHDYAKALEYYQKAATSGDVVAWSGVSWMALFTRDFPRALAAVETAQRFDPQALSTEAYRGHALMFLGRTDEARALYLSHLDQTVPDSDNKPWQQVVSDDFVKLRQAGLDNPLMKEIEAAFAAHKK